MTNRLSVPGFTAQSPFPALPEGSEVQRLRQRADAILWVKAQMARNGISFDDLVAAGCFLEQPSSANAEAVAHVRYKDAQGHIWNGNGELPDWLQRAVNAGQSVEHFRVK